jgi:hypothetical protein
VRAQAYGWLDDEDEGDTNKRCMEPDIALKDAQHPCCKVSKMTGNTLHYLSVKKMW